MCKKVNPKKVARLEAKSNKITKPGKPAYKRTTRNNPRYTEE